MSTYRLDELKPGKILAEGKTKTVRATEADGLVLVTNKDDVTGFDNPDVTIKLPGKGAAATETTCNVMEALRAAGITVAYAGRTDHPESFVATYVNMLPLECIQRRWVIGPSSYRKRHPELPDGDKYFGRLWTEFGLKTTGGKLELGDQVIASNLDPLAGEEDPLIGDFFAEQWRLYHNKKPQWLPEADLTEKAGGLISRTDVMGTTDPERIEERVRRAFIMLEAFWASLGFALLDLKLEPDDFGLGDVVDGDSWRLQRVSDGMQLSKQVFRDMVLTNAMDTNLLVEMYQQIAQLTRRFRIPNQALVLWRGSAGDDRPELPKFDLPGVEIQTIALSGHKKTYCSLAELERLHSLYPEGGVIVDFVGRSNGLGPISTTHTHWPVISVARDGRLSPNSVWSSLDLPSGVPMGTVLDDGNAIGLALRILAMHNPALVGRLRYITEETDVPANA